MCQCLCSDVRGDLVFRPKNSDVTVAIDFYPGCRECAQLIGVDVRLFDTLGVATFFESRVIQEVDGDEFGHVPSFDSIALASVDGLVHASKELPGVEDYENVQDWLEEHGLALLQGAFYYEMEERRIAKARGEATL